MVLRLEEAVAEGDRYFRRFDEDLKLKEVVAGARCPVGMAQLERSIAPSRGVKIVKARLAFRSFRVVENKLGFRGSR